MQYPTYQQAGWPIGSGSVESANKLVVEARLKGAGMRWKRQNVNPMLLLRNAVCNGRWKQTWASARAHQQGQRVQQRQAESQQRLDQACWSLAYWAMRLKRVATPSSGIATTAMGQLLEKQSAARGRSGYSWRQPFLRRPASSRPGIKEVPAKK
jgi:hypothetical protein